MRDALAREHGAGVRHKQGEDVELASRERIAHEALGYDYVGDTNNVDVHIAHLRAKIEDAGGARIIQTVRGVGYVCRT